MTTGTEKLNGSIELLAKAMHDVFRESIEAGLAPMQKNMEDMENRLSEKIGTTNESLETRLTKQINTTNENVQAQLAQHRKDIAMDIRKQLAKR